MKLISKISELEEYKNLIDEMVSRFGKIYFHNYYSMVATFKQKQEREFVVIIDDRKFIVSAFEKTSDNLWQCCFSGFPLLIDPSTSPSIQERFLENCKLRLNAETLYFPLIYKQHWVLFSNNKRSFDFERLPCPIVGPPFAPEHVWQTVCQRYGSRANRQKMKFEKNLKVEPPYRGSIRQAIARIELNSWKHKYKQDMLSRENQLEFYISLIESGVATVKFACDATGIPVAFRIDARVVDVLYVLKWSYDDNYKQFSPGFYLLTVDLFKNLATDGREKYQYIDLYGSPDSLKDTIKTSELSRIDYYLASNLEQVQALSHKRQQFDEKMNQNYQNKNSIKKAFEPS